MVGLPWEGLLSPSPGHRFGGVSFFSKQHLSLFYQSASAMKRKKGAVGLLRASPCLKPTGEQDGKQEEAALGSMVNQRD